MNRFCVALEVITTCDSSATHVTDMVRISSLCDNVPFKVPLCMEIFITLNTLILWCLMKYFMFVQRRSIGTCFPTFFAGKLRLRQWHDT